MSAPISQSPLKLFHSKSRQLCRCRHQIPVRRIHSSTPRAISTTASRSVEYTPQQPRQPQSRPRWAQTPPLMTAPYRIKPLPEDNDFTVNDDPAKLDRAYVRLLGEDGDQMLTEEVKWVAITHKSFDHGRRGYNDRLSMEGKGVITENFLSSGRHWFFFVLTSGQ